MPKKGRAPGKLPTHLKYDKATGMWAGHLSGNRRIYVSESLYDAENIEKRGRRNQRHVQTSTYWEPIARIYQEHLGDRNTEAYIENPVQDS